MTAMSPFRFLPRLFLTLLLLLPLTSLSWAVESGKAVNPEKPSKSLLRSARKHLSLYLQRRHNHEGDDNQPDPMGIFSLTWQPLPDYAALHPTVAIQKFSLAEAWKQAEEQGPAIAKAQLELDTALQHAKEMREPNLWTFLTPLNIPQLKSASDKIETAGQDRFLAARQGILVDVSQAYGKVDEALVEKYLAFQTLEKIRLEMDAGQQKFVAGDVTQFEVSQTEQQLLAAFQHYQQVDQAYLQSALQFTAQLGGDATTQLFLPDSDLSARTLVSLSYSPPQEALLAEKSAGEKVQAWLESRPDVTAARLQQEAVQQMVKITYGADRDKQEFLLKQAKVQGHDIRLQAAGQIQAGLSALQAAQVNVGTAQQAAELADKTLSQMRISRQAGFNSDEDVLSAQILSERQRILLLVARLHETQAQIQLLATCGMLVFPAK